ncbi:hypothetical protein D9M69_512940 [compost metagenome]
MDQHAHRDDRVVGTAQRIRDDVEQLALLAALGLQVEKRLDRIGAPHDAAQGFDEVGVLPRPGTDLEHGAAGGHALHHAAHRLLDLGRPVARHDRVVVARGRFVGRKGAVHVLVHRGGDGHGRLCRVQTERVMPPSTRRFCPVM